jgi:hypothetical protein
VTHTSCVPRSSTLRLAGWLALFASLALIGSSAAFDRQAQGTGSGSWRLARNHGTIAGFADRVSAAEGETVGIYVTTPSDRFDVELYRLGWYDNGASEARLIQRWPSLPGVQQPAPESDAVTGLISCANWARSASFAVQQWPTGIYVFKLIAANGDDSYIPLVVRDDVARHDFLFEHSAATDQAYNAWGGKSFYEFNSTGEPISATGGVPAVKASFDRPFDRDGAGSVLVWEHNMIRFLEANQFDVGYVSDVDLHADPSLGERAQAILQVGHNEYWSKEMRDHLEQARDRGTGLGFFTGDTGTWAIRFEDSALGPNRTEVFYGDARLDPLAAIDPPRTTTRWYQPPLSRPVQDLIGIGTNAGVRQSADWAVEGVDRTPELFEGTGFQSGDVVTNLVGYEYDGLWTQGAPAAVSPAVQVFGRARVLPTRPIAEMLDLEVQRTIADRPIATTLSTLVKPGHTWQIFVRLSRADGSWVLEYKPGSEPTTRFAVRGVQHASMHLGPEFVSMEWRVLERDLVEDFRAAFGIVPDDLRVDGVGLRGQAAVGPLVFDAARPTRLIVPATTGASAWHVTVGSGSLTQEPGAPDVEGSVRVEPTRSNRPVDEAHSVATRTPAGGLIVAVGTIQWSWALDAFGQHTDRAGNYTPIDPRLQALTRNILLALRRGTQ